MSGVFIDGEGRVKCAYCYWIVEKCKCGEKTVAIAKSNMSVYFTQWLQTATKGNVAYSIIPDISEMCIRFWCMQCDSKLSVPYTDDFTISADVQEYVKFHRHEPEQQIVVATPHTTGTITLKPGDVVQYLGADGMKTLTVGEVQSTSVTIPKNIEKTQWDDPEPVKYGFKMEAKLPFRSKTAKKLETPKTGRRFR